MPIYLLLNPHWELWCIRIEDKCPGLLPLEMPWSSMSPLEQPPDCFAASISPKDMDEDVALTWGLNCNQP